MYKRVDTESLEASLNHFHNYNDKKHLHARKEQRDGRLFHVETAGNGKCDQDQHIHEDTAGK